MALVKCPTKEIRLKVSAKNHAFRNPLIKNRAHTNSDIPDMSTARLDKCTVEIGIKSSNNLRRSTRGGVKTDMILTKPNSAKYGWKQP
jgi:hypothetical protein